jgi:uncharacterized repeat protein (TIGR01451 family)
MKRSLSFQLSLALAVLFGTASLSHSLRAAGTAAGTTISNQATVNYQVGGVSQTAINSNNYQFVVDRKINLSVATTDGAAVAVTPGSSINVLTFTLQNTGNGTQDFNVSAVARAGGTGAFGGTDNVNAASASVFVESGATVGYQAAQDTATYVDELAADGTKTIYIVGDFSSGTYTDGQIASYHLLAEARVGGAASSNGAALTETAGADTAGSVDIVFADGQGSATSSDASRDAKYSEDSDFEIASASLTVTKASAVISDPFNSTTNPKAIPGAVIEYTITITNASGASTATSVSFTDSLNTEITAGTVAFQANGYAAGKGIRVTSPNINGGAALDLTNAGSDDQGDWNVTSTNVVTVTGIQLAATEAATIKFRVQIQ